MLGVLLQAAPIYSPKSILSIPKLIAANIHPPAPALRQPPDFVQSGLRQCARTPLHAERNQAPAHHRSSGASVFCPYKRQTECCFGKRSKILEDFLEFLQAVDRVPCGATALVQLGAGAESESDNLIQRLSVEFDASLRTRPTSFGHGYTPSSRRKSGSSFVQLLPNLDTGLRRYDF